MIYQKNYGGYFYQYQASKQGITLEEDFLLDTILSPSVFFAEFISLTRGLPLSRLAMGAVNFGILSGVKARTS
jgi:hypothetical protein